MLGLPELSRIFGTGDLARCAEDCSWFVSRSFASSCIMVLFATTSKALTLRKNDICNFNHAFNLPIGKFVIGPRLLDCTNLHARLHAGRFTIESTEGCIEYHDLGDRRRAFKPFCVPNLRRGPLEALSAAFGGKKNRTGRRQSDRCHRSPHVVSQIHSTVRAFACWRFVSRNSRLHLPKFLISMTSQFFGMSDSNYLLVSCSTTKNSYSSPEGRPELRT